MGMSVLIRVGCRMVVGSLNRLVVVLIARLSMLVTRRALVSLLGLLIWKSRLRRLVGLTSCIRLGFRRRVSLISLGLWVGRFCRVGLGFWSRVSLGIVLLRLTVGLLRLSIARLRLCIILLRLSVGLLRLLLVGSLSVLRVGAKSTVEGRAKPTEERRAESATISAEQ